MRVEEARFICCHSNRTAHTMYEPVLQCGGCQSLWHQGCWEFFLEGKQCCKGKPITTTKYKDETHLMQNRPQLNKGS